MPACSRQLWVRFQPFICCLIHLISCRTVQEAVNSLRKQLAEVQAAATEGELRFGEATAALSAAQSNVHRLEAKLKLVSGQKQANVAELEQALAEAQAAAGVGLHLML